MRQTSGERKSQGKAGSGRIVRPVEEQIQTWTGRRFLVLLSSIDICHGVAISNCWHTAHVRFKQ